MSNLHVAIEAHHSDDWAHADIRLENVCFNSNFQPVLIDLDRSICLSASVGYGTYSKSCMYNPRMSGEQFDYLQLGWLALWVAMPRSVDYHDREFDDLPEKYNTDAFLTKLIKEGKYDIHDFSRSTLIQDVGDSTVEEVIRSRLL